MTRSNLPYILAFVKFHTHLWMYLSFTLIFKEMGIISIYLWWTLVHYSKVLPCLELAIILILIWLSECSLFSILLHLYVITSILLILLLLILGVSDLLSIPFKLKSFNGICPDYNASNKLGYYIENYLVLTQWLILIYALSITLSLITMIFQLAASC